MPHNPIQPVERPTVVPVTRLPSPVERPTVVDILDRVSLLMDRLFEIPGTRWRFGLNSILLLVPVLGDILPTLISAAILAVGLSHQRVPRIVAARMVLNAVLDASLGWIPVFGDFFDMWFKADTRNVRLLQQYAGQHTGEPRSTWRHWLVVVGAVAGLLLVLGLVVLGAVYLLQLLIRAATHPS